MRGVLLTGRAAAPAPLVVADLCFSRGERQILASCDLQVAAGEAVAIMGPSGAGKSTLLWMILGLMRPDGGTISISGERITGVSGRKRARVRRQCIGVVFQQAELLPELTPLENVALPMLLSGGTSPRAVYDRAELMLQSLGVDPATPTEGLSGGEQQRVAVARALVVRPAVVLADEPTGSLDEDAAGTVLDQLSALVRVEGSALVVVTHDPRVAARSDRILTLSGGRLDERRHPAIDVVRRGGG